MVLDLVAAGILAHSNDREVAVSAATEHLGMCGEEVLAQQEQSHGEQKAVDACHGRTCTSCGRMARGRMQL